MSWEKKNSNRLKSNSLENFRAAAEISASKNRATLQPETNFRLISNRYRGNNWNYRFTNQWRRYTSSSNIRSQLYQQCSTKPRWILNIFVINMCFTEECLEVWKHIDSPQTGQNWLKFGVEIPFDSMSESFEILRV